MRFTWPLMVFVLANMSLATASYGNHRELQAIDQETMDEAQDQANAIGASARESMKQLRGGTEKFYDDLITAVNILYCNELVKSAATPADNPALRLVLKDNERAYVTQEGECIRVNVELRTEDKVKSFYSLGGCEVKPNCYWGDFDPVTDYDRRPVYSLSESMMPPAGAMSYPEAEKFLMDWLYSFLIFVVPGIVLAILSFLTLVFFLLCRCCCNRCGGRSPRPGGYTFIQKFLPVLFFFVFSAAIAGVVGVSSLYQNTIIGAIDDTFVGATYTLGNSTNWIGDVKAPLIDIRDTVVNSADDIQVKLDGSDFIEDGIDGLILRLSKFSADSSGRTLPEGCVESDDDPYCIPCEICQSISDKIGQASKEIKDNAGEGVDQLKQVRRDLNGKLVEISQSVRDTVNTNAESLDVFVATINDTQGEVDVVQDQFDSQEGVQDYTVIGIFAFPIIVVSLGVVGIVLGLTPCKFLANIIHIAYLIGFITLFITFLISSITLALSVVVGDVCEVTAILADDWTIVLGADANALNACFRNESLIEVLNLTESLSFARGGIEFPENQDMSSMLDFSKLDSFAGEIGDADESTFAVNDTQTLELLDALNEYTNQPDGGACNPSNTFTLDNILTPWTVLGGDEPADPDKEAKEFVKSFYSDYNDKCLNNGPGKKFSCGEDDQLCSFSDFVGDILYHPVHSLALVKRDSSAFVEALKTNMTRIQDYTSDFKTNITDLDTSITEIKDDLQANLILYVDQFEEAMYCTFLADRFFDMYGTLCDDLLPAFLMLSIMILLSGIFLIPVTICLIIAVKRLKARGNGSVVMDNELKFK